MRAAVVERLKAEVTASVWAQVTRAAATPGNLLAQLIDGGVPPQLALTACVDASGLPQAPAAWLSGPRPPVDLSSFLAAGAVPLKQVGDQLWVAFANPEVALNSSALGLPPHRSFLLLPVDLQRVLDDMKQQSRGDADEARTDPVDMSGVMLQSRAEASALAQATMDGWEAAATTKVEENPWDVPPAPSPEAEFAPPTEPDFHVPPPARVEPSAPLASPQRRGQALRVTPPLKEVPVAPLVFAAPRAAPPVSGGVPRQQEITLDPIVLPSAPPPPPSVDPEPPKVKRPTSRAWLELGIRRALGFSSLGLALTLAVVVAVRLAQRPAPLTAPASVQQRMLVEAQAAHDSELAVSRLDKVIQIDLNSSAARDALVARAWLRLKRGEWKHAKLDLAALRARADVEQLANELSQLAGAVARAEQEPSGAQAQR